MRSTDFRKPSEVTADFRARLALILAPHGFACRAKGARFVRKRGRNVFGGVIGAAVTAWLAPAAPPPAPATVDLAPLQKQIDALSRGNARSAARLTSLEVEGQKPREQTQAPSSDPPQDSEAVPPRRQTPEEQRQEQADLLTAHASEPVDRAWATGTRDEVSRALTQLDHPGKMEVTSVECRSSTCLARLQWPSRTEAYEVRRAVQALSTDLPCERRLYLGDEGVKADGYEGTLLLTCER